MARKRYDIDSIKIHQGLEGVRGNPSMYIGTTDSHGVFTILREVMDNAVDEFVKNEKFDSMHVQVFEDGYLAVHDNGEGIPIDTHEDLDVSGLEVVMGHLHAGGKLDEDTAYRASRGTHGIGVSATNALSEHFIVNTCWKGKWYAVEYENGELISETSKIGKDELCVDPIYKRGTIVLFRHDPECFDKGSELDVELVHEWADITSYLAQGFSVTIEVEGEEETSEYVHEGGVLDWVDDSIETLDCGVLNENPMELHTDHIDLCLTFTDADGNHLYPYCNGLRQVDEGNHVSSTMSELYASLSELKGARDNFTRDDLREGLLGIINFKVDSPRFSSQTKEKLVDGRFDELCKEDIRDYFAEYWSEYPKTAKELCRRASTLREAKNQFAMNKKSTQALKKKRDDITKLPGKLATAPKCKPHQRELFIVEGDSAAGTADSARMEEPFRYQETLGLKGKITNPYKSDSIKLMGNEEVLNILAAIGYDPLKTDPLSSLRVGKIILLSDPDPDGYHIDALVLSVIAKVLPELFYKRMIYTVTAPKYVLNDDGDQYFGMTLAEIREKKPKKANMDKVSYLKGWGEANAISLREIAFDPLTRHLIRIDKPESNYFKHMEDIMGPDVSYRKKLLNVEVQA